MKINPVMAGVLILLLVFAAAHGAIATNESAGTPSAGVWLQPGQRIVFEGDSLTARRVPPSLDNWAYLRLMNWDRTYADRVAEWIFCNRPDLNLTCHNAAVGGSTAGDSLRRYEKFVQPHKPALVIMTIGANDSSQQIPLAEFKKNLTEYCNHLAKNSNGRLLVLGGFKPFPFQPADEEKYANRVKYDQAIQEVLAAQNGIYLDVGTPLFAKAGQLVKLWEGHTVYSDNGHLNAVGNEILATQVLQAIGFFKLAP